MANTSFTYKDFDISFQRNATTGDIYTVTDNDAVKRSVKLLVTTALGEKLFHPEIGSSVYSSLFENLDASTVLTIQRSIKDVINNFEPRATLLKVDVIAGSDDNSVNIQIFFYVNRVPIPVSVTVNLERIR